MNKTQKTISLAIGSAFALSIAATAVQATENPFAIKSLASGYQVADNHAEKSKDGKCGAGKCGASKKDDAKAKDGKCGAGKCGASKKDNKAKDGACGGEKAKEGACGGEKK
ncbi:MAG: hypothetical protein Q8L70_05105 [Methylotenera sp.]|nr:hypothetical protein [Methylotenera sp.]MDP1960051.1 hypothetical protein [Methylotenera sp.]MDP3942066.1 hypothetical protein [Methylotenera sp.]